MIVNESFKKGFVTGLSMNPLYVGEGGAPEKPKPLIRLELNGNLDNTGTYDGGSITAINKPNYEEGLNGKLCYSAKANGEIRIRSSRFKDWFANGCTLVCFVKCDALTTRYNRRIFYSLYTAGSAVIAELQNASGSAYGTVTLSYSGSAYRTGMSSINDGQWHCVAVTMHKGVLTIWQNDNENAMSMKTLAVPDADYVALSHYSTGTTYCLRGCIQDFRFYDKCLSYEELREIAKEGGL